jgi:hypothetical protein
VKRGDDDVVFELDMFKQGGVFRACWYEGRLRQPIEMSTNYYDKKRKPSMKKLAEKSSLTVKIPMASSTLLFSGFVNSSRTVRA